MLSDSVVRVKGVKWCLAPGCHESGPEYTLPTLARSQHNFGTGFLFALLSEKLEGVQPWKAMASTFFFMGKIYRVMYLLLA